MSILINLLLLIGLACVTYGTYLYSLPMSFIVGGIGSIALGILIELNRNRGSAN